MHSNKYKNVLLAHSKCLVALYFNCFVLDLPIDLYIMLHSCIRLKKLIVVDVKANSWVLYLIVMIE